MVVTVFHDTAATMPPGELEAMIHAQLSQAGILTTKR